ncbi:YrhK family protein [Paenibacillus sp. GCM10028914]|uniref:YrhK family protein n=1 Tax=Paenibacillus sp. GCM10028914 TaxID=3273416 RepID=UPI00360D8935
MINKARRHFKGNRKHRSGEPLRSRMLRRVIQNTKRKRRLTVTNRYETGMILSEIVTGLLFISGSILMFYPNMRSIPTVLYLIGSIMMLLRSGLRASYWFRLKSLDHDTPDGNEGATGGGDWSR